MKYSHIHTKHVNIPHNLLPVPQNIVTDLNNVMVPTCPSY